MVTFYGMADLDTICKRIKIILFLNLFLKKRMIYFKKKKKKDLNKGCFKYALQSSKDRNDVKN